MPRDDFSAPYSSIKEILQSARSQAFYAVNTSMIKAYWQIGRVIVEEEQKGKGRAEYGKKLIVHLSSRLRAEFGNAINERNLWHMKNFYLTFTKVNALRSELTWTHYRLLLRQESKPAQDFYLNECINSRWSTRELERQMNSLLYERLALSKDKKKLLKLSKNGQVLSEPQDMIKDPFILEFTGLGDKLPFNEIDLEGRLIKHLKTFLLELGHGFSFVGRQERISVDSDHYYVDLVFYNYLLKCFVLIDLKVGKLSHQDIGQMDFYVRYYEKEIRQASDNPTIGLILCSDKNSSMARYTLLSESKQIFASKYKLILPKEEDLKAELDKQRLLSELQSN